MTTNTTLYCSFCGKSQHEVLKLIAGPTAFICDECSDLCAEIVGEVRGIAIQPVRAGGVDVAHVRLRAFEALRGWGSSGPDGKWAAWGMEVLKVKAEGLAEWAMGKPLTTHTSARIMTAEDIGLGAEA